MNNDDAESEPLNKLVAELDAYLPAATRDQVPYSFANAGPFSTGAAPFGPGTLKGFHAKIAEVLRLGMSIGWEKATGQRPDEYWVTLLPLQDRVLIVRGLVEKADAERRTAKRKRYQGDGQAPTAQRNALQFEAAECDRVAKRLCEAWGLLWVERKNER
jgi:hypothetical protein